MRIVLAERFQRNVRALPEDQRSRCFDFALLIPRLMGQPHKHSGAGLRKLHRSGIWEAGLGLGLRMLITYRDRELTFVLVGNHDDIRRHLAAL